MKLYNAALYYCQTKLTIKLKVLVDIKTLLDDEGIKYF